jgi:two-component system, LuxR family, sensor histidine kinase DctS
VRPHLLLEAIMPLVSLQARKLGVNVVTDVGEHCEPVLCDRTMVEQVLLNLSRNGMQAMQDKAEPTDSVAAPGKTLSLQIRRAGDAPGRWVEFSVIDRGEGISENVAEQLFTPFFTTRVEGMGLGLSLCRTVIEQHGGALAFEPVVPRGTRFYFTLPVAGVATREAERTAAVEQF